MILEHVNKALGRLVATDTDTWTCKLYEGENVRDKSTLKLVAVDVPEDDAAAWIMDGLSLGEIDRDPLDI